MHIDYGDITDRISEPPIWWLDGVPRYKPFQPHDLDVYARKVVLLSCACQSCGKIFLIGQHGRQSEDLPYDDDPPSHSYGNGDECAGTTMTMEWIRIIQYWSRMPYDPEVEGSGQWARDSSREVVFDEDLHQQELRESSESH